MRKYIIPILIVLLCSVPCFGQYKTNIVAGKRTYLNLTTDSTVTTIKADDCSANNTGDWSLADCTLGFDTDHYEVVYTASSQFVYQSSVSTTNGNTYTISADVKDGASAGVSGRIFLATTVTISGGVGEIFTTTNTWQTITKEIVAGVDYDTLGVYSTMVGAGDFEIKNIILSEGTASTGTKTYLRPPTIGVEWNQATDTWRHIDINGKTLALTTADFDSYPIWGNMKRCNMDDSGNVTAYKGTPGFAYDGSNGKVMVEIPTCYVKSANPSANVYRWWVTSYPREDFVLHYAFRQGGDGAPHESQFLYVGAYEAGYADNKLQSRTGVQPKTEITINQARTYAQNIGAGWQITNFWELALIRLLYYIEYADADSQTTIGQGIVNKVSGSEFAGELTGADNIDTNVASNGTGSGTGTDGLTPIAYRGIENLWGNVWTFIDGYDAVNASYNLAKIDGTSTFVSPLVLYSSSITAPITTNGYQTNILYEANLEFAFLPSAVGGSSSTYLYDYFYAHDLNEVNVLLFSGSWNYGAIAGVGCLGSGDEASRSTRSLGCRLEFLKE